ncbi:MAG: glycosyltransferase [Desulfobacterales bacterium]|nr:MAG: glycosyltransferase [Desulfobacterales bacterium]
MIGRTRNLSTHTTPHILFIAPQPFYEDRGTPIANHQALVAMSDLGFKVDLATFPIGSDLALPGIRLFRTANPFRFRSVPIGLSFRKIVLDVCLLMTVLRLVKRNHYDCIQGVEEGAALALAFKALRDIPVIYDMQSSLPEQLRKVWWLRAGPGGWTSRQLERWLVRNADCILASSGLAPHVSAIDPQKPVFECSYTGSNPRPNNKELEKSLGITGRPTVVYTGTFAPYQGLEDLLEAAVLVRAEIPGVVFILVGGTGPELNHFRKLVEKCGLADTVKLQLRRPRQEIPDFLALADVLVLARKSGKNVPLKIYDYLESEKPIVATNIPAHRAILNEKTAVLVEPDPEALSGGILRALTDTDLSKKADRPEDTSLSDNNMKSLRETIAEAYRQVIDKSL